MKVNITSKHFTVSKYLNELIEKKLHKLDRFFPEDSQAYVTLNVEKNRHTCEISLMHDGLNVRAKETTGDMYASLDDVIEKLEKQIVRHRTKLEKRMRQGAFDEAFMQEVVVEEPRKIVRTKRFALKPMDLDEAIMQMELLGHTFFVFTNSMNNEVNVLYLRDDGELGLIERAMDE